jgi:hypothetical protein
VDLEHERRLAEAILMRACAGRRLRWSAMAALLLALGWPDPARAQRFYPDDPLEREPTPLPAIDPGVRNLSLLLEGVSATLGRRGERHPDDGVIAAQSVNTLGEVLDGPWFVNRHARTRLSREALQQGAGSGEPPSLNGPWRVMLAQTRDSMPRLVFRDANQHLFLLRFDSAGAPEMATGAEVVASRFFHALGYHVPAVSLVSFTRDRLVIETNASDVTSFGNLRELRQEDLDRLLERVARREDGSIRAVALRIPVEIEALIGPFQFFGTRSDDPNDIVPHEHRRELRGLHVFAAWLNHSRIDPTHTMDTVIAPEGEPRHIRHYLFDFMATLGSGVTRAKPVWEGNEPIYARNGTLRNIAGLGLYSPAWMRASFPGLRSVGRVEANTFDPERWTPLFDLAPFDNRLPDDTFWAARHVMAFTDEDIRAIVEVAQYSDPAAARWIGDTLIERRNRIGRAYFAQVLPLDGFAVRGTELVFTDLAVAHGFAGPRRYLVDWWQFDNAAGKPSTPLATAVPAPQVPAAVTEVPAGSYVAARITAQGEGTTMAVNVYLRKAPENLRVVGIDREWPRRRVVDPRVAARPVRNRYAELEPERQKLFAAYTQMVNAKSGDVVPPEERFAALSPSQQTTYDGVTHALMRSPLTDQQGQPLGTAFDLVTGVERIAGQETGRGGDQQFRLYVTLRPDARETLARSREFVRSHENTVYHAGYPHSFRLGSGVPSVQFSLSEDGLNADIDVDYRTSKAPQSLFNGHLTSSNSDVRAGNNSQRHGRRWTGFADWWSALFGDVVFRESAEAPTATGPIGTAPSRTPGELPPNRPAAAPIPEVADAMQEFLADWLIRRNYREAQSFLAPDVLACVADSLEMDPKTPEDRLRRASLELLERSARSWGRPRRLAEAMNPVFPWSPAVRVVKHAFDRDFTIVEAPTELGRSYECGATPPTAFKPTMTPEYGTYYAALLQVVTEGRPGGTMVFVWRRLDGEWRLVAYRAVE